MRQQRGGECGSCSGMVRRISGSFRVVPELQEGKSQEDGKEEHPQKEERVQGPERAENFSMSKDPGVAAVGS